MDFRAVRQGRGGISQRKQLAKCRGASITMYSNRFAKRALSRSYLLAVRAEAMRSCASRLGWLMRKRSSLGVVVLILTTVMLPVIALTQVKSWTDDQGVTHFGNNPRPKSELEKIATLPGEQQITIEGLKKADIVKTVQFQQLFPTWPAVYIGLRFYRLSDQEKSEALWAVLREARISLPKVYAQLEGKTIDRLTVWDGGKIIGTYTIAAGYTAATSR